MFLKFLLLPNNQNVKVLRIGDCLCDDFIVRAKSLSDEPFPQVLKQEILTRKEIRIIWREGEQFVDQFTRFRHGDYARVRLYIVLVDGEFLLGPNVVIFSSNRR